MQVGQMLLGPVRVKDCDRADQNWSISLLLTGWRDEGFGIELQYNTHLIMEDLGTSGRMHGASQ